MLEIVSVTRVEKLSTQLRWEHGHVGPDSQIPAFESSITWDLQEGLENLELPPIKADLSLFDEIASKTVGMCEHLQCYQQCDVNARIIGKEVGDDRIDICASYKKIALVQAGQDIIFGMVTSQEDTFISADLWNYCEFTGSLPLSKSQSFNMARKTGSILNLGYVDIPPLRVIMDSSSTANAHISSRIGKFKLLSGRRGFERGTNGFLMEAANWFQDGMLASWKSTEPKYLLEYCSGSGCRAAWGCTGNILLSMLAYRGGGYHRLYGSATQEMMNSVRSMDLFSTPLAAPLCKFLRLKQDYLYGTYGPYVALPPMEQLVEDLLPAPLCVSTGSDHLIQGFLNRMTRVRLIVDQKDAEKIRYGVNRNKVVLFSDTDTIRVRKLLKDISLAKRDAFFGGVNANSAFINLVERKASQEDFNQLVGSGWDYSTGGQVEFTYLHAEFHSNKGHGTVYQVDDIPNRSTYYVRSEVEDPSEWRVPGIIVSPQLGKSQVTTLSLGLWQIGPEKQDWAQKHLSSLLEIREDSGIVPSKSLLLTVLSNPQWVSDDTLLVGQAIMAIREDKFLLFFLLVSTDRNLARHVANATGVPVYLLLPKHLLRRCPGESFGAAISADQRMAIGRLLEIDVDSFSGLRSPVQLLWDSGSVEAAAVLLGGSEVETFRTTISDLQFSTEGRREVKIVKSIGIRGLWYQTFFPESGGTEHRRSQNRRHRSRPLSFTHSRSPMEHADWQAPFNHHSTRSVSDGASNLPSS